MENNIIHSEDTASLYFSYLKLSIGSFLVGIAIIVWFLVIPDGLTLHGGVYRYLLDNNFSDNGINLDSKLRFYNALFFTVGTCLLIFRRLNYSQTSLKLFQYGIYIMLLTLVVSGSISGGGGEFVIFGILFMIVLGFVYIVSISWVLILLSYILERNQKKNLNLFILFTFIILIAILFKLFIHL